MENGEYEVGDRVRKVTGDYQLDGVIRAVFTTSRGHVRYVVEHEPGFLHIYSAANLSSRIPRKECSSHEWVDARNKVVQSGEFCRKCGAVQPGRQT